jgi:threonine/homoserine/homoserine lactone efflux protein
MYAAGALVAGVLAGLTIAIPVGAIAVLLITEGLRNGHRAAVAGAFGIATVDLAYSSVAMVAGGIVTSLLSGHEKPVELVAAAVLLAVGVNGIVGAARTTPMVEPGPLPRAVGATYLKFVGLTAVNPATALYFVALAATLGARVAGPGAAVAFVVGVLVGSLSWQLVLALGSASLGPRLSPGVRRLTSFIGFGLVSALAVALAIGVLARG